MEYDIVRNETDPQGVFTGRERITTSCLPREMQFPGYIGDTLDEHTIGRELVKALSAHQRNAKQHKALKNIYLGKQAIMSRAKGDRWTNNKVCINYAQAFTRDITGYTYGGGIQYVANGDKTETVEKLNAFVRAENKDAVIKSLGDAQSIGGRGFLGIFPDSANKNEVPFEFVEYDPETTEVVYSAFNPAVPVFAWTTSTATEGDNEYTIYNVWTSNRQYTFKLDKYSRAINESALVWNRFGFDDEGLMLPYRVHLLGEIPIIEYANNEFRLGDWECAVSLFDAINSIASDGINDVEQTVASYLALFGVEIPGDTPEEVAENIAAMKQNRILIFNAPPGVNQDAKFLTAQLDGTSASLLRTYLEEALKIVVGIPDRDTGNGGSDTGMAAQIRSGSGDIEIVASNKSLYTIASERRALRVILNILKANKDTAEEFSDLSVTDIDIEIPRNKTDNLQSKVQSMQMLNAMGVSKIDVAKVGDLTTDLVGFVKRWEQREADIAALEKKEENIEE